MEYSNHQEQLTWESSEKVPECERLSSEGIKLPIEIISEILSRLPVQTVLRFRSVCKAWFELTCTDTFIHQHLNKFFKNESYHGSISMTCKICDYALDYCYRSMEHSRTIKIDGLSTTGYTISNCCNGLVCVYNYDVCNVTTLIINPAIDNKFVQVPDAGMTKREVQNVCLCHDDAANKYKVLRFYSSSDDIGMGIEVLTLGEATWRQVGEVPTRFDGGPLYASGAMHWMTNEDKIFFFKVSVETFGWIECPAEDADDDGLSWGEKCRILTVYEGCLCIVRRHWHPWKMKFFVMEDYVNRLWIEYAIDLMEMDETPFTHEYGFQPCRYKTIEVQNGKFLLNKSWTCSSGEKFYYYNPKTVSFETYDGTLPQNAHYYKESLVSARRICNEET